MSKPRYRPSGSTAHALQSSDVRSSCCHRHRILNHSPRDGSTEPDGFHIHPAAESEVQSEIRYNCRWDKSISERRCKQGIVHGIAWLRESTGLQTAKQDRRTDGQTAVYRSPYGERHQTEQLVIIEPYINATRPTHAPTHTRTRTHTHTHTHTGVQIDESFFTPPLSLYARHIQLLACHKSHTGYRLRSSTNLLDKDADCGCSVAWPTDCGDPTRRHGVGQHRTSASAISFIIRITNLHSDISESIQSGVRGSQLLCYD